MADTRKVMVVLVALCAVISGCALKEGVKVVLGTSTKALEEARDTADRKIYRCSFDDCFDAVLSLDRNDDFYRPNTTKFYEVFLKDRVKGHIVVMGVHGNVNTTEVGIFLTNQTRRSVMVDVVSLSSSAQEKVTKAVFDELDSRFSAKE